MMYFLRHCSAAGQGAGAPLTEEGHAQAEALVPVLSGLGLTRVYSSPYRRAVDSVAPFVRASGLPLLMHPGFHERRAGLPARNFARVLAEPTWQPMAGESAHDLRVRAAPALRLAREAKGPVLIATLGQWLTLMLATMGDAITKDAWLAMPNPALFVVDADGWRQVPT